VIACGGQGLEWQIGFAAPCTCGAGAWLKAVVWLRKEKMVGGYIEKGEKKRLSKKKAAL
jgi:hypothetical protein